MHVPTSDFCHAQTRIWRVIAEFFTTMALILFGNPELIA
jgi:hypothetical protein